MLVASVDKFVIYGLSEVGKLPFGVTAPPVVPSVFVSNAHMSMLTLK